MIITVQSEADNGGSFNNKFEPRIDLVPASYEVALVRATVCYGWPNISAALGNNIFKYRPDNTSEWITVTIPDGTYTLTTLDAYMKAVFRANNHYDKGADTRDTAVSDDVYYISLSAVTEQGRVSLVVSNSYQINLAPAISMNVYSKFAGVLGFSATKLFNTDGSFVGDAVPNFNRGVVQVQIHCNLVNSSGSYTKGKSTDVIWTFMPNSPPYSLMTVVPQSLIYLPMIGTKIQQINIQITDQDGNVLPTGGEPTAVTLDLRVAR